MKSITDKTRKLLWGPSGNRCVICKCELIMDATKSDNESVVGEECHIISKEPNGPRSDSSFPPEKINSYENLLLLCRVHHKMVDDQEITYSADVLRLMKENHEKWVSDKLNSEEEKPVEIKRFKKNVPEYLIRVTSGKELLNMVDGSCSSYQNHPELENEYEVELVGDFFYRN